MTPVLVVGAPRSGTSWVGRVLGSTEGATYLGEPDNHEHTPFALRAKLGVPGYFYPAPDAGAAAYERLWREALTMPAGLRRETPSTIARARRKLALELLRTASEAEMLQALREPARAPARLRLAASLAVPARPGRAADRLVVKSVHAQLALEWIVARFPVRVLIVLRHPLNVLSSWKELGWLDGAEADPLAELDPQVQQEVAERLGISVMGDADTVMSRAAWLVGLLTCVLTDGAERHPDWVVVAHESLCERPHELFAATAERLGLHWTSQSDELLDELDRPGTGYETMRVASDLVDVWRTRLTPREVYEASSALERFRLDDRTFSGGSTR
jgi:hypothetical protein